MIYGNEMKSVEVIISLTKDKDMISYSFINISFTRDDFNLNLTKKSK